MNTFVLGIGNGIKIISAPWWLLSSWCHWENLQKEESFVSCFTISSVMKSRSHRINIHVRAFDWVTFWRQTQGAIIISQLATSRVGSKVWIITFVAFPINASVISFTLSNCVLNWHHPFWIVFGRFWKKSRYDCLSNFFKLWSSFKYLNLVQMFHYEQNHQTTSNFLPFPRFPNNMCLRILGIFWQTRLRRSLPLQIWLLAPEATRRKCVGMLYKSWFMMVSKEKSQNS